VILIASSIALPVLLAWLGTASAYWAGTIAASWPGADASLLLGVAVGTYCIAMMPFRSDRLRAAILAAYVPVILIAMDLVGHLT